MNTIEQCVFKSSITLLFYYFVFLSVFIPLEVFYHRHNNNNNRNWNNTANTQRSLCVSLPLPWVQLVLQYTSQEQTERDIAAIHTYTHRGCYTAAEAERDGLMREQGTERLKKEWQRRESGKGGGGGRLMRGCTYPECHWHSRLELW